MRIAVISDIHGNFSALMAVIDDSKKHDIDMIICLGDIVGYGPEPEKCVEYIMQEKILCLKGNHDFCVYDDEELEYMNKDAYESILLTREMLSEDSVNFLKNLPRTMVERNLLFVHGCPPDSFVRYIFEMTLQEMTHLLNEMDENVVFVGHTHFLKR